ncbi:hypothetical protein DBL04_16760 [Acinetobacter seifertii]|nr:hypothetical protein DBL04_16760 [Acinetobacter seifertii]
MVCLSGKNQADHTWYYLHYFKIQTDVLKNCSITASLSSKLFELKTCSNRPSIRFTTMLASNFGSRISPL